jgi:tetratricopeptide (TPR) repeat protein/peroxiredoxin
MSLSRRHFLQRCCQGASMAMVPAGLHRFAFFHRDIQPLLHSAESSSDGLLRVHPRYPSARPLDATLLKVRAGSDKFVTEQYVDRIEAILGEWRLALLQSTSHVLAIEKAFASDFSGSRLRPTEWQSVREGSPVEVDRGKFDGHRPLDRDAFRDELRATVSGFSDILTAEFQITGITSNSASPEQPPGMVGARVRYEFVGAGAGFYREQRVGHWQLDCTVGSDNDFRIQGWQCVEEIRSRSLVPVFADITAAALGRNSSYSAQMLRGVDHWRTVLDGACGVDIYGHNGVSVADIHNDGLDDLYVCQPAGLPNRLYRNRGDGTFEDVTELSGLGLLENTACAIFADYDNDGKQDVVLVRADGPLLFLNQGDGKFRRSPDAFKFANAPRGTFTGAAVADYDCDGWLDIYFCLYSYYQGTDQYKYPVPYYDAENGPPNFMMRNNRDGTFGDVTEKSGMNQNNTRYSFCCGWSDYNSDRWPDLYVVNDFGRKNLYRNNGNGTFTDVAATAGVEDVGAGMSVCWLDYENDGVEDLYVANMWTAAGERISTQEVFKKESSEDVRSFYRKHAMGNSLLHNVPGSGKFQDATQAAGVGMGRWSWSSDAFDFDHDGYLDLYIANGMVSGASREDLNGFFWRQVVANSPERAGSSNDYEQGWSAINELIRADGTWSGYERNVFYANNRDGTFSDVSGAVGLDFVEDGRSFALADFDGDGRQEAFLKNRNGPQLRLLKNVMEKLPSAIVFRLRGTRSNRDAIGAQMTLHTGSGRQTRKLQAGSGFLAQHSKELFFGLGSAEGPLSATVRWPSGLMQNLHDLKAGTRVWVEEGSDTLRSEPFRRQTTLYEAGANPQAAESLPALVETWMLVPIAAPDFSLSDLSGQVWSLAALRGKLVLLNFWVTQSPDCDKNLRALEPLHRRVSAQGLQVLAVNVDDPTEAEALRSFAGKRRLSLPVLAGTPDVAGLYNVLYRYLFDRRRDLVLPTSFLIDERGDIVKIYSGPVNVEQIEGDSRGIPRTPSERLALALPFSGESQSFEYGRNYLSYGANFFQRGYFEQAAASFQLAAKDDPSSAEACYGLGSALLNLQKVAEARESFERATRLKAGYPNTVANAWNNLGLLDTREGRTQEAVRFFQQALQSSPDHLIALNNLGNAFRALKRWDEAGKVFERALSVDPADAEANYGLGMVFAQADDTVRASEYLQQALKSRPIYPEALNNLGILYLRTQRPNEAVAKFEECIRLAPEFDQSYLNLAKVYSLQGSPQKARAVLLDLLKQHPGHAQAQNMLTQIPQ